MITWHRDQRTGKSLLRVVSIVGSAAAGGLAAAGVVLLVGVLRRSLFGDGDWILPLRPPAAWCFDWSAFGTWILTKVGSGLAAIGCREGYLACDGRLLAGHAELILCVIAAGLMYAVSLFRTSLGRKPTVHFCTAVYLLVCIGTAGVVLAGVAFWLDRYGLPTPAIVAGAIALVGLGFRTDHFFQLQPRPCPSGASSAADLPFLQECFQRRLDAISVDADGTRTAIVVTASGGGIQAAAWAAEVLTRLDEAFPGFRESLCLVSGVSGGSVGAGLYLAGTYLDPPGPGGPDTARVIRNRARASLLEYVAWGVAFADLPRLFTGFLPWNRLVDRGWAVEQLLEKRLSFSRQASWVGRHTPSKTLRDLSADVAAGKMPVPLFNATCVQTGQRVIISPVQFATDQPTASRSLHLPADYSRGSFQADATLATAIRLSATFSYASPVARPTRADEAAWQHAITSDPHSATPSPAGARFDLHLCDGGYADNTGVVAAMEAGRALLEAIKNHGEETRCRVLLIRIEPFPRVTAPKDDSQSGFSQALFGPAFGLLAARMATQQERADREADQFITEARKRGVKVEQTTFRFGNDSPKVENPPLSWSLTHRQQTLIEKGWHAIAAGSPRPMDLVQFVADHEARHPSTGSLA